MILLDPRSIDQFTEKVQLQGRAMNSEFARRMRLLAPQDRLLVEMAVQHKLSRRQMGTVLGVSPGNVSRRLRRIINRLHDPLVVWLTAWDCSLSQEHLQIGLEHFLLDKPINELARQRGISPSQARAMLEYIRGWYRGSCSPRAKRPPVSEKENDRT